MSKHADGNKVELEPGKYFQKSIKGETDKIVSYYLFQDSEPPFEKRNIQIKQDKWVSDEFELLEFLGK